MKATVTISLLLLFAPSSYALEANSTLVDQVKISTSSQCNHLMLYFYAPTLYLSHFPNNENKIFQVRIKAVSDNEDGQTIRHNRHLISIPLQPETALRSISYEDKHEEPYLLVEFDQKVYLDIQQSKDPRRLHLRFAQTKSSCTANKTFPE